MQRIIPHLWYDREAREAAEFYIGLFENSRLTNVALLEDTPSGDAQTVSFELAGQPFLAISAGPHFEFNPSISLMVACDSVEEVDTKWRALSEGGTELMALGEYPFSKRYGWIQDGYGLSWQLMLSNDGHPARKITPDLLFTQNVCGKAEEAVRFYVEVFENSGVGLISKYAEGEAQVSEAKVNYASFNLDGVGFVAMDHGYGGDFTFSEAFSLVVQCRDQREIDYYWDKLSAVPEAEQCGWVKDKFGVSWQILPHNMAEFFLGGSREETQRVTEAFLKMKKFDLEALERARLGR